MTEEEKEAIEQLKQLKKDNEILGLSNVNKPIEIALNLIQKQQEEIKKKEKLEKEVADDIDKVAVELSKLSDNIYIINQAMMLQKIAQEKLGKFYID